jgi:cell division protein FtsB
VSARAHPQRYRARPAPRSGSRASRSRVNWEKLGRRVLVVVLFAVLASYLNPVVNLVDAWRDSNASKEHLVELKAENADLSAQVARAATEPVLEREARKMGMVRPGERLYVVELDD